MFLRAVLPGFFGSEDAPTTATLLGLKNAPSADTSCMVFLSCVGLLPGYRRSANCRNYTDLIRVRVQRKITKTDPKLQCATVVRASPRVSPHRAPLMPTPAVVRE